ncbi:type II CAAX prenyl endopeptidase Rce1 family protein [Siphonobacter sp. SORGH_AS_1065]|uniref:CPBP family glutamic-type intramembrane protease n=1 Tax=Siphonobacter sp. SORGH_AS_1065 TaxID=3041795 RepID=UPI002781C277|nr:CPBP family glutamic-type intramembrane protease [Siphonobacter sp. SORGH_AS_1065]MDQ1089936.1 membrane protease YdiL (CAAX protease family) [Siphonobacter sp. SORGH_AS_1065]
MKEILTDFFSFLRSNSNLVEHASVSVRYKCLIIGKAFIALLIFKISWAFFGLQLLKLGIVSQAKGSDGLNSWLSEVSEARFILQVVLLAPLFEELAFRGILQRKKYLFIVSVFILIYLLVSKSFSLNFYTFSGPTIYVLTGSLIIALILHNWSYLFNKITLWVDSTRRLLIWLSAIGFAFWHYHNYDFDQVPFYTVVLVLFPHFMTGLLVTWLSLRYGFFWGLLLHMINNAIPAFYTLLIN